MLSDQEFVFRTAAWATLYVHASIVLFNVFWLVAIPLGVWQGWTFIRNFWWRIAHLVSLAIVAAQVIAGRLCFLTIIQDSLFSRAGNPQKPSLFNRLIMSLIYWPLPDWVFLPLYVLAFVVAAIFWFAVPPARPHASAVPAPRSHTKLHR